MKKYGSNLLLAGMCVLTLAGCSTNNATAATTTSNIQAESQPQSSPASTKDSAPDKRNNDHSHEGLQNSGIMAKITSTDGDTITVTLADRPENGKKDNSGTHQKKSSGDESKREKPADGSKPEKSEHGDKEAKKPEMSFSGETKTYTIPSSATITKGKEKEKETATISDLTVDSVISITMDGDTITKINIIE